MRTHNCFLTFSNRFFFFGSDSVSIILSAEVYGRIPEHDAHHEKIRFLKENDWHHSSLPQQSTKYTNIEVKQITHDHSSKLVIGTKVLDALITCSSRIDCKQISMGASTHLYVSNLNVFSDKSSTFHDEAWDLMGNKIPKRTPIQWTAYV